jgi:hypothetical protein
MTFHVSTTQILGEGAPSAHQTQVPLRKACDLRDDSVGSAVDVAFVGRRLFTLRRRRRQLSAQRWSAALGTPEFEPGGFAAISRWLSEATPPVCDAFEACL